jgi:hypothetical protein
MNKGNGGKKKMIIGLGEEQMRDKLKWKIDTISLLTEIVDCAIPKKMVVLYQPVNQLRLKLWELAELGREIDDPRLHLWLCEMTLYSIADPKSEDYDPEVFKKLEQKIKELKNE